MCYWGTWANYRPDGGKFTPEHIDPTLCTHLIYSFAGLEQHNWTMKSLDPWMDLDVRKNICESSPYNVLFRMGSRVSRRQLV